MTETDKRIAEIRGDEWLLECIIGCESVFQMDKEKALAQTECPACGEGVRAYPKPYTTDIACAYELAEEMKKSTDWQSSYWLQVAFNWYANNKDMELSEAIAEAWIKWRESQ